MINLDNLKMNAVKTAENGVINQDTIFKFRQSGTYVWAEYSGGKIVKGFLTGINDGLVFKFRYCQIEEGDILNGGSSDCELNKTESGQIEIIEHFKWESRDGYGTNIIREI